MHCWRAVRALAFLALISGPLIIQSHSVKAQEYPNRPVKIIISVSVGGAIDIFLRALGEELQKQWGQPLVIEARPGGNFLIAARACAEAASDGYTLCALTPESLIQGPLLNKNAGYIPNQAFTPISLLFYNTLVIVAHTKAESTTLKELGQAAKKQPLAFAYITLSNKIILDRLNSRNGTDIVAVPTRGGSDVLNSLLAGSVTVGIGSVTTLLPFIQDGRIVPLATDSIQRSQLLPNVPTLEEAGFDDKIARNYWGLVAPTGVPHEVVEKVQHAIYQIASAPDFRKRQLIDKGLEPVFSSPQTFADFLKKDTETFVDIMKEAKIEAGK
jgi:tripartite-type tricarboxylate transporter receptor subunit TctC